MNCSSKYHLLLLLLITAMNHELIAQTEKELEISKCVRIEGGYILGNQIFSDEPFANQGGMFSYTYGFKANEHLGLGLGSGVNIFESETFVPVYMDMIVFLKKKKNSGFFDFKAGYGLCWSNNYGNYTSYEFKGGLNLGFGLGRRISLNERFCFLLTAYYNHQFATLRYSTPAVTDRTEKLNYNLLTLSAGFLLEQK